QAGERRLARSDCRRDGRRARARATAGGDGRRMKLAATLRGTTYTFRDVKDVLAKANEEKSGDRLAGVAAATATERVAAKLVLSELTLEDLFKNPVLPYDEDAVTRLILDDVQVPIYEQVKSWTVAQLREHV